uniref:Uncharacterized protein n=1 Tax=Minutocellus polymorphus TaxID=265543 RepID=A0A7S0ANE9_9STRA
MSAAILQLLLLGYFTLPSSGQVAGVAGKATASSSSNCTLCGGGSFPADPAARFKVRDDLVLNCSQMFDIAPTLTDEAECEGIRQIGDMICQCNPKQVTPCTLCSDGSAVPDPDTPILPDNTTCSDLEGRAAADFDSNCPAWQSTAGVYCGCQSNNAMTERCDICPGELLPDPFKDVEFVDGTSRTCLELEVEANRGSGECGRYQQLYAEACECFGTDEPSDEEDGPSTSDASTTFDFACSQYMYLLLISLFVAVIC